MDWTLPERILHFAGLTPTRLTENYRDYSRLLKLYEIGQNYKLGLADRYIKAMMRGDYKEMDEVIREADLHGIPRSALTESVRRIYPQYRIPRQELFEMRHRRQLPLFEQLLEPQSAGR